MIRLTREEWETVEEQCKDCHYWTDDGCNCFPPLKAPLPVKRCDLRIQREVK